MSLEPVKLYREDSTNEEITFYNQGIPLDNDRDSETRDTIYRNDDIYKPSRGHDIGYRTYSHHN